MVFRVHIHSFAIFVDYHEAEHQLNVPIELQSDRQLANTATPNMTIGTGNEITYTLQRTSR